MIVLLTTRRVNIINYIDEAQNKNFFKITYKKKRSFCYFFKNVHGIIYFYKLFQQFWISFFFLSVKITVYYYSSKNWKFSLNLIETR